MATSFTYDDNEYEIGLTRAGVRSAEEQGLSTSQITEKPFSALSLLFYAGLYSKYHTSLKKATSMLDKLLDDKSIEFDKLLTELSDEYVALFGLGESEE